MEGNETAASNDCRHLLWLVFLPHCGGRGFCIGLVESRFPRQPTEILESANMIISNSTVNKAKYFVVRWIDEIYTEYNDVNEEGESKRSERESAERLFRYCQVNSERLLRDS